MQKNLAFGSGMRVGVLGGGQLGRMMLQVAANWDVRVEVMDPAEDAPCRFLTHRFVQGDLMDADAVYAFGKRCDVVTIEIEHVSVEGLRRLRDAGVRVVPDPEHLALIQDKGRQKEFLVANGFPTAPFTLVEAGGDRGQRGFPVVQKLRKGGYDGKGVSVLRSAEQAAQQGFSEPSLLEDLVPIEKELSVIVARNADGATAAFPVVEAVFDPHANLVDYLLAPADVTEEVAEVARGLALQIAESMQFTGLLAVEMFLDSTGQILINELAPRTHNSGHHTIEAHGVSQFEQHLRAVLGMPLGDTTPRAFAAMLNLVGAADAHGSPLYVGLGEALARPGVHAHIYGKSQVKPFRKMGHVTVTGTDPSSVRQQVLWLKSLLAVHGQPPSDPTP